MCEVICGFVRDLCLIELQCVVHGTSDSHDEGNLFMWMGEGQMVIPVPVHEELNPQPSSAQLHLHITLHHYPTLPRNCYHCWPHYHHNSSTKGHSFLSILSFTTLRESLLKVVTLASI